jgi:hypothetical protein
MMNLRFTQINMLKNHFIKAFEKVKEETDEDKSPKLYKNLMKFHWGHLDEFIPCYLLRCVLRSMEEVMKWQATLPDRTLPLWLEIKAYWMEHKKRYIQRLEDLKEMPRYVIPKVKIEKDAKGKRILEPDTSPPDWFGVDEQRLQDHLMNLNLTDEYKLFSKLALVDPLCKEGKSHKNALKRVENEIYEDFPQWNGPADLLSQGEIHVETINHNEPPPKVKKGKSMKKMKTDLKRSGTKTLAKATFKIVRVPAPPSCPFIPN